MPRDAARVGLLGGTFDPPHVGHLATGVEVRDVLDLDAVWLVVANEPWQKVGSRPITPAVDRLAMVQEATRDIVGLEASGVEIDRGGPSYTVDTLVDLRRAHPEVEWFVVLGADAAAGLPTWERAGELADLATFVLVDRPGLPSPAPPAGWRFVHVSVPRLDVSSSELRDRVRTGRPLDVLVPAPVIACIEARRLYGWGTT
ncbi:nicotinate-nucleotide adenylyltransferase [Rhabdothermincola salaria]|uniref:nicotinate-nucleotide adenylyltransferase n=1 Tax=Rhabdothermincola salaria TaxID=2903142 RepID=UPI001E4C4DF0|nr:nicotinate-nucleotide adenylyltransferase [Rhabdothermincola salaria]MCD9622669.1 nicotinate-nucleotide adenylyltransferase [Rhabdothermincola salaria]